MFTFTQVCIALTPRNSLMPGIVDSGPRASLAKRGKRRELSTSGELTRCCIVILLCYTVCSYTTEHTELLFSVFICT